MGWQWLRIFIFLPWSSQWPASLRLGYWIYFFKKEPPCDYCRWSSNYWNMWTGSPSPPPCVEEEALPAFCPVPLVARKQLSNFECFAVYEWWQNPDLSLGMCRKSVFYLRFSAIKPTKVNLLRNLKKQDCTFLLDSFFSIRYYTIWFLFPLQYPFDVYAYFEYPECNMIVSV